MGVPSLWAYKIIWWVVGVFLIWFLANKMDLSTLPKKPILNGDEHLSPDDVEERGNYIDRMGGGYGRTLLPFCQYSFLFPQHHLETSVHRHLKLVFLVK